MKALLRSRIRFLRYLLALVFLLPEVVQATHLRAGNILMTLIDCELRRYRIRVEVYTNTTNTNVLFGGEQDYLDFGDRTGRILVPEIGPGVQGSDRGYSTDGLPAGTARAYFEIEHTFAGPGTYTVSYVEPNRNAGVVNMDQSVNTTFYLETQVVIDPFYGCSSPAILEVPPVDRACTTVAWFHNPGAKDLDGDRLSYQMVIPFRDRATTVLNYKDPNDAKFYSNYNDGRDPSTGDPPGRPVFNIDAVDGTVTWNAPGTAGEYNIAFIVIDWRLINGQWRQMGFVRRDMQILVEECDNKRPDLIIPEDVCVTAGTTIDAVIKGTDPDGDRIRITAFSETFDFPAQQSPATYTPRDEKNGDGSDKYYPQPTQVAFHWSTECEHVRQQPYTVNFKVQDERGLVNYKTWRITVVGPAPIWNDANLNVATRTATIKWDRYLCQNAELIEVWRKVDSTSYRPDTCQTGMPAGLGYKLIATVPARIPPSQTTGQYVDNDNGKGLAPGAMYCYRLVAVYPLPQGGESYVTKDTCVGPIPADVPIITNVSIERTSAEDGLVRVSWKRPFDLDPIVYRKDSLKYEVYRGTGFTRSDSTLVATLLGDTTYLDGGMNTESSVFNYSIVAYNGYRRQNVDTIGASEVASSVRLGSSSQKDQITLDWQAEVPWSNQIEAHPYHYVYRGGENDPEDQLVLVDSIRVTESGFQYIDTGLESGTTYCYRILTNGGYGNPNKIPEPLENFSQRICVQPGDSIPPCKPLLTLETQGCSGRDPLSLCLTSVGSFSNIISWARSDAAECQTDIVRYYVYRGGYSGDYTRIDTLDATTTRFEDKGLSSLAFCYRVSAVDFSGNESEMSDAVCNDNCPAYGLPNVFSPNGDDYNPVFKAFSLDDCGQGGETSACPSYVLEGCARFVKSVRFNVYNRWGREVYTFEASAANDESILINWNGKDKNGHMLDPAVYYYVAEVTFDVLNPNDAVKTFKGWVHLLNDRQ
jgi:hypothetical protein